MLGDDFAMGGNQNQQNSQDLESLEPDEVAQPLTHTSSSRQKEKESVHADGSCENVGLETFIDKKIKQMLNH